ncbi:MAG: hypothetical protein GX629_06945 [Phycisphaerae bacterium]|jgi:hypothetical protein|nr:hypothetical protein [Phycisphaerae bacterium]
MNRKIEKLTEVLSFADSAGPQVMTYFCRWFDELARQESDQPESDLTLLITAASRVLKTLFVEKVHGCSALGSRHRVSGKRCVLQGNKIFIRKKSEAIRKMLMNEIIKVAQQADAGWILQADFKIGHNSKFNPHESNSTSQTCT